MYDRELTLYRFLLGYGKAQLDQVEADVFARQPWPGCNHPAWTLGHLALVADMSLKLLGRATYLPASWEGLFGMKSQPVGDAGRYPPKAELVGAWEAQHARLAEAARAAPAGALAGPNPIEILRPGLPTAGDLLAHVLTTHEASHLGQLAAWRRAVGLPVLF